MDVVIELGDPIVISVTGVHPIALPEAMNQVLDAALRLNRELRSTPDD